MNKIAIAPIMIASIYISSCWADSQDTTQNDSIGQEISEYIKDASFGFGLKLGTNKSSWRPGLGNSLLDFDTQGFNGFYVNARLLYGREGNKHSVISFRYEQPFSNTEEQKKIMQQRTGVKAGLISQGIDFDAAPFIDLTTLSGFLKYILSPRIKYKRNLFVGKALSRRNFLFFSLDSKSEIISRGDELGFESEIENLQVIFPIRNLRFPIRWGMYRDTWTVPLHIGFSVVGSGIPIVFESEFESIGAIFEVDFHKEKGINVSAYVKYGLDDNISTVWSVQDDFIADDLKHLSVGGYISYMWKFQYISFEMGVSVEQNKWWLEPSGTLDIEEERISQVFFSVEY